MNMPNTIVCRCEEVTLEEIADTAKRYRCSSREVKLRTRAGMGFCGGRTCRYLIEEIVRQAIGHATFDTVPLKYQPPVRPVSFSQLGGEQR